MTRRHSGEDHLQGIRVLQVDIITVQGAITMVRVDATIAASILLGRSF